MKIVRYAATLGLAMLCLAGAARAGDENTGPMGSAVLAPIVKLPNAGRPLQWVSFPAIADWKTLKMTLSRTACFGNCPSYRVEIAGDGTVRYEGRDHVAVKGEREALISADSVHALYDAFVKADFFWTLGEYRAPVTDFPTYEVTISFDGRTKRVVDYAGKAIGMPKAITELEKAIDDKAETKKWVKG
jgi:hypothetical protein